MSLFLFHVPSTLYTGQGHCSHLMGSHSSLVYFMLMKFLVAPKSRSTVVLALFWDRWMNRCNCIDFHMEKYILSDPVLLIQATWIRPLKTFPPELLIKSSIPLGHLLGACLIVGRWNPPLWCWSRFHCPPGSSRWAVQCMCSCVSVWWGNCKQNVLALCNWNMHPVSPFGFKHCRPWLHFPSASLVLCLSSSLLVLWFDQDP